MKCWVCGAKTTPNGEHEVHGVVVERLRVCTNGHQTKTYEINDGMWRACAHRLGSTIDAIEARAKRFKRNQSVLKERAKGTPLRAVGEMFGLTPEAVRYIETNNRE